ncbi:DUF4097 domain-containing protein [Rhodoflexus caldus]|uniref:DUF4097 domain-containing protein n=1 Tax=Rhodoflexus caldus TaxID=2891236 RepID=UPI002029D202|nr:DUF4097 domain-containing protein [Rhodoflexus caldus]
MKTIGLLIFALMLICTGYAQEYKTKFPGGSKGTLQVITDRTNLTVEGYNGDELIIVSEGRTPIPDRAKGLKSLYQGGSDNTGVGVEVTVTGTTVEVKKAVASDLKLKIRVPKQATVSITETNWQGSQINIQDVEGAIEVKSNNSNVMINNARTVVAKSISGNIEVIFSSLHPELPSAITNTSGEIDVTLPPDSKVLLKTKSINGDIFTDFDVAVRADKENLQRIGGGNKVEGTINGGGTELRLETISSNIYLRKKK